MRFLILIFLICSPIYSNEHVIVQENFEAWQFTCVNEQSQKVCDLRELVFDPNTQEVVSYISISINPDNLAQMQIAFPHAVNLKNPIKIQIDDNDAIDLKYAFCNQSACFVAEIIAENFINLLKAGSQLNIKALLLDNREANITYSLVGFTSGYNRLFKEVNN